MISKKFLLLTTIICIAISCKKPVLEVDPNFVGFWDDCAGGFYPHGITIDSDGTGSFSRGWSSYENYEHWEGKVKASKTRLKIGNSPNFHIIEFPTSIDTIPYCDGKAAWKMILAYPKTIGYDGLEFTLYKE